MSFTKAFVLFLSFVVSVHALATPHSHHGLHHRALAARLPSAVPADPPVAPVRRRSNSNRCRPRSSTVSSSRTQEATEVLAHTSQSTTTHEALAPTTTHEAPAPTTTHEAPAPTTTHEAPAPTTTHEAPATTPKPSPSTSKEAEPPATTKKPSPPPSSNLPSFMVGTQTGQGTFYSTGLGACGITNKDTDHIAAVSHLLFDDFPGYNRVNSNTNPICGRKVTATYKGKSVTVAITDRCTGCSLTDLDFSPSAFNELADPALGRLSGVTWDWDD